MNQTLVSICMKTPSSQVEEVGWRQLQEPTYVGGLSGMDPRAFTHTPDLCYHSGEP